MRYCLALLSAMAFTCAAVAGENTLSRQVSLTDERGVTHPIADVIDRPSIFVPIFTSCSFSCPVTVNKLLAETSKISGGESFRVILFSFDLKDREEDLRAFREIHKLPPSWMITTASPGDTQSILSALAFKTMVQPDVGFVHPSEVAIIGSDLSVKRIIPTAQIDAATLETALNSADPSKSSWLDILPTQERLRGYAPFVVFPLLLAVGWFMHLLTKRFE